MWDWDMFWYDAAKSAVGTLGAASVALLVFGLTRWRDARKRRKDWRISILTDCSDSLGNVLRCLAIIRGTDESKHAINDACMAFIARNGKYRRVLGGDPLNNRLGVLGAVLSNWCAGSDRFFRDFRKGQVSHEEFVTAQRLVIDELRSVMDDLDTLILTLTSGKKHAKKYGPVKRGYVTPDDIWGKSELTT